MIGCAGDDLRFQQRMIAGFFGAVVLACWPAAQANAVEEERRYVENQEVLRLFRQREEARTADIGSRQRSEDFYWMFITASPMLLNPPDPYCRPPHFAPPPPYRDCLRQLTR